MTGFARCLALLGVALVMAPGCDSDELTPPVAPYTSDEPLFDADILRNAERLVAAGRLRVVNTQRGFECGHHDAWDEALFEATELTPSRWRGRAIGTAFIIGLVLFGVGFGGVFLIAFFLPRWRQRQRRRKQPRTQELGWFAFFKDVANRHTARLGRLMHADYFDRAAVSARVTAIHNARDSERILRAAMSTLTSMDPTITAAPGRGDTHADGPAATEAEAALREAIHEEIATVSAVLETWRRDNRDILNRLEASGPLLGRAMPQELVETLVASRNAATEVHAELVRAEASGHAPTLELWRAWRQRVDGRPELPHERQSSARTVPSWVRPTGWAGIAGFVLGIPLAAMWAAAGGFPFILALMVLVAAMGATLTARVYLFTGGGLPLLPGLADKFAGWLTTLGALTAVMMFLSNTSTAESGLDLGDPPPISAPSTADRVVPPVPGKLIDAHLKGISDATHEPVPTPAAPAPETPAAETAPPATETAPPAAETAVPPAPINLPAEETVPAPAQRSTPDAPIRFEFPIFAPAPK